MNMNEMLVNFENEIERENDEEAMFAKKFFECIDASAEDLLKLKEDDAIDEFLENDPRIHEIVNLILEQNKDIFDEDDQHDIKIIVPETVRYLSAILSKISEKNRKEYRRIMDEELSEMD